MNLYEIHSHTKEISSCSQVGAEQLVLEHYKLGFKGVVITDHYYKGFFDGFTNKTDKEIVSEYLKGYKLAKAKGDELGLNVMLGIELRFI